MEKIIIFILLSLFSFFGMAQKSTSDGSHYINVQVNAERDIKIQKDAVPVDQIENRVDNIIHHIPFKLDQKIVYRIFADENLPLEFIQRVENEMLKAYSDNVKRERFLLNTRQMNLDGPDWLKKINFEELKASQTR